MGELVKSALVAVIVIGTLTLAPPVEAVVGPHAVINEVELNPDPFLSDHPWVELYNGLRIEVDLSGWMIAVAGLRRDLIVKEFDLSQGLNTTIIEPAAHLVVNLPTGFVNMTRTQLVLFDRQGSEVDRTPLFSDTEANNDCWARIKDGLDSDSMDPIHDWSLTECTPGAPNTPNMPVAEFPMYFIPILLGAASTILMLHRWKRRKPLDRDS